MHIIFLMIIVIFLRSCESQRLKRSILSLFSNYFEEVGLSIPLRHVVIFDDGLLCNPFPDVKLFLKLISQIYRIKVTTKLLGTTQKFLLWNYIVSPTKVLDHYIHHCWSERIPSSEHHIEVFFVIIGIVTCEIGKQIDCNAAENLKYLSYFNIPAQKLAMAEEIGMDVSLNHISSSKFTCAYRVIVVRHFNSAFKLRVLMAPGLWKLSVPISKEQLWNEKGFSLASCTGQVIKWNHHTAYVKEGSLRNLWVHHFHTTVEFVPIESFSWLIRPE